MLLKVYNCPYCRLISDLEQQKEEEEGSLDAATNQWHEVVDDLWTSEKYLLHLREDISSVSYVNVFDPSTELYGFQSEPDNPQPELLPPEQLEPQELQSPVDPSPKPVPEPPPSPKPSKGLLVHCVILSVFVCKRWDNVNLPFHLHDTVYVMI